MVAILRMIALMIVLEIVILLLLFNYLFGWLVYVDEAIRQQEVPDGLLQGSKKEASAPHEGIAAG